MPVASATLRFTCAAGRTAQVSLDVANTGKRAGPRVVQLHVRDHAASVARPVIELNRFERVTLQPGERRSLTFELTPEGLSPWKRQMKHVEEVGTFTISRDPNSLDLESAMLTIIGWARRRSSRATARSPFAAGE